MYVKLNSLSKIIKYFPTQACHVSGMDGPRSPTEQLGILRIQECSYQVFTSGN